MAKRRPVHGSVAARLPFLVASDLAFLELVTRKTWQLDGARRDSDIPGKQT